MTMVDHDKNYDIVVLESTTMRQHAVVLTLENDKTKILFRYKMQDKNDHVITTYHFFS